MTKKRVLFVDDEPNILDGLRRMLRSMRKELELSFAESGNAALEMMKEREFDIIVSDMRMPGMDGAQLLTEVKNSYPQSIRIMLTGQADDESVMRTIGVVHQFLAKPCDPDKLKDVLRRSGAIQEMINDGDLKEVVSGIDTLPSMPELYMKITEKLKDSDVSLSEIGAIVAQDIAMSAKVLQLVNSAFFGLFQKVESPERAVTLLGIDTIKALVMGLQIFSEIKVSGRTNVIEDLWQHSLMVGKMAKEIAQEEFEDSKAAGDCFIAGILHDVGKLVFLSNLKDKYEDVFALTDNGDMNVYMAEKQVFNSSHSQVGAFLTGIWGFPTETIEAIGFHHNLDEYPVSEFSAALAIHIADYYYHTFLPEKTTGAAPQLNLTYIEKIGLRDKIEGWKTTCDEVLKRSGDDQQAN